MHNTKGILLSGGAGSRLYPLSKLYSKQLVAVYDKPMIYYPLSTLINVGIREILIISDNSALPFYQSLFGDGKDLGLSIEYAIQLEPKGIAEALIIGGEFIGNDNVALILGDNIFYGCDGIFRREITEFNNEINGTIFALYVKDPTRYGVVRFSSKNKADMIVEKPETFVSNYAVPGFYVYDSSVVSVAKKLQPSKRGELEITDVNNYYLQRGKLNVVPLNNEITWLDSGTPESLLAANNFIASVEQRHYIKIGCYEEAAYQMNLVDKEKFTAYINTIPQCDYKEYLKNSINSHLNFDD